MIFWNAGRGDEFRNKSGESHRNIALGSLMEYSGIFAHADDFVEKLVFAAEMEHGDSPFFPY